MAPGEKGVARLPLVNYHPNIWGDYFLNYTPDDKAIQAQKERQIDQLKEDIKEEIVMINASEKLQLIETLERLGVAYHFEKEIEEALQQIHQTYKDHVDHDEFEDDNLYDASLRFRLLRQHGFYVSSDIFKRFKGDDESFKKSLTSDIKGMLSLFEASYLKVHGEYILDEARVFTKTNLESWIATKPTTCHPLAARVVYALKQAMPRGIPRLESRHYISMYELDPCHNKALLKFAKLDFNLLQSLHLKELKELSRWWTDLDFKSKLCYIRDRLVESYVFSVAMYYEPKYSLGRKIVTQLFKAASVVDDTFDNTNATIEDLELFNEAIQRWNISFADQLPDYMKLLYRFILDTFEEFERDLEKEGRAFCVHYLREELKALAQAYLHEAKWFHGKYIPNHDEYFEIALASSACTMLIVGSYLGMGEITEKEAFESVKTNPKAMRAACIIGRLMDDIVDHKLDKDRDYVATAVKCYLKQYDVSEEVAHEELHKLIENAWMDINEEILGPTTVPMPLLARIRDFARAIDVIYKDTNGFTIADQGTKENIEAMFINPIQI